METCPHFNTCGGCTLQDKPYAQQLELKKQKVQELLAPYWQGDIPVAQSPDTEYFRNKIELSFSRQVVWKEPLGKKKVIRDKTKPLEFEHALGFRIKGRWDRCIDLKSCLLFNDKLAAFVEAVRTWAKENNLSYYDQRTHIGVLRNIIMREGKNTGEGMVVLVSAEQADLSGFAQVVSSVYPDYSVLTALNDAMSDGAPLTDIKVLKGAAVMREILFAQDRKVVFELYPQSFFQTNTRAANVMYDTVRDVIKELKPDVLYDLYGGAGSFSLCCSDIIGKSLCVESVAPAVVNGQQNAKINNAENIQFYCEKTEDFLTKNKISKHNAVILLDPPRSGLHPAACKAVLSSGVKNVLYISCNPVTLAENLKILSANYTVKSAQCFDFFPHTSHIETFVILEQK